MALTPVEIRHIRLRKAFFGYQARQTDELLSDVVTVSRTSGATAPTSPTRSSSWRPSWCATASWSSCCARHLISAERASQQMTDQTRRESEAVLAEARAEAREIVREAMAERERLNSRGQPAYAHSSRPCWQTIGGDPPSRSPDGRGDLRARPARSPRRGADRLRPIQHRAPGAPAPPAGASRLLPGHSRRLRGKPVSRRARTAAPWRAPSAERAGPGPGLDTAQVQASPSLTRSDRLQPRLAAGLALGSRARFRAA